MKKHIRYIIPIIISIFVLTMMYSLDVEASGWVQDGEKWKYLDSNNEPYQEVWLYDNGWYYFNKDGYMSTGLQEITLANGNTFKFYFCPSDKGSWKVGRMMTGWQYVNGKYMYFNSNGEYESDNKNAENTIKGIDVSQYQGNMDWTKVKAQGIKYAFIRIGHGNHKIDPYFKKNMTGANSAGIKTGIYFYSTAKTSSEAKSDAQWVIKQLEGYTVNYPVAVDMEDNSQLSLGKQAITDIAKTFCNEIKAAGYTPMIYCNENWSKNYVDLSQLDGVYRWIARYSGSYNTNISRDIWQAGSTTLLDGIDINSVDINFAYKDFSTIVTPRTKYVDGYTFNTGSWQKASGGWWYDNGDGTYPANKWFMDGGKWYYFNASGYSQTGWVCSSGRWYYLSDKGMLEKAWLNESGKWYYLKEGGSMTTDWLEIDGAWYYFNGSGAMQTGWVCGKAGWYYLSSYGMLQDRWYNFSGKWYYFRDTGVMATGWEEINGKWYYFYGSGEMAKDTTINGYKLDADGQMIE